MLENSDPDLWGISIDIRESASALIFLFLKETTCESHTHSHRNKTVSKKNFALHALETFAEIGKII